MSYLDNKMLFELYDELDSVIEQQRDLKRYREIPEGKTFEQALQELEEEEYYIRMKIDELSIVQSDYFDCEY